MKQLTLFTIAALVLFGGVTADQALFSGCSRMPEGDFYLYGDWLYWNTRRCGLDFALPLGEGDGLIGPSDYYGIRPDYQSGYRLGGRFRSCSGFDFSYRWNHFTPNYGARCPCSLGEIFPTRNYPATAEIGLIGLGMARYQLAYNEMDFEIGSWKKSGCEIDLRTFLGVKLVWIDERYATLYATDPNLPTSDWVVPLAEKNDFKAVGLTTGFELVRQIYRGLGFQARGGLGLLALDSKRSFNEYNSTPFRDTFPENESDWIDYALENNTPLVGFDDRDHTLVGNFELAAGLEYLLLQRYCLEVKLAAGYEFHGWYNTKDFLHFINATDAVAQTRNKSSFSVDGLYIRLLAAY